MTNVKTVLSIKGFDENGCFPDVVHNNLSRDACIIIIPISSFTGITLPHVVKALPTNLMDGLFFEVTD